MVIVRGLTEITSHWLIRARKASLTPPKPCNVPVCGKSVEAVCPAAWTTPPESTAMAKELKRRGFRFVGPTTAYALMQATGMVDDHTAECWVPTHAEQVVFRH